MSITFFLIFLLIKKKDHRRLNLLLGGILFCFLSLFVTYASITSEINYFTTFVMSFALATPFALGPLLNFYVDEIYQVSPSRRSTLVHFLPFFLALLIFSIPVIWVSWIQQGSVIDSLPYFAFIIPVLGIVFLATYLILLFKKLKKYALQVKNNYASLEAKDLSWLKNWVRGIFLFVVLDISLSLVSVLAEELHQLIFLNVAYLFGLIVYIGYSGIQQTPVFLSVLAQSSIQIKPKPTPTYHSREDQLKSPLENKLIALFENEEIYLNENLSLNDVASEMAESPKKITEILNTDMNTNFYAFVNHYRVASFKRKLSNQEAGSKTLLGLAYESGFKSKATFNRAFKEITGMTPKGFKDSLK